MQHFRSLESLKLENAWLTIGSFDGVHRGHQQIIHKLTAGAHAQNAPAVVLTFDPHPLTVLRPDRVLQVLTTPEERAGLLGELGVDYVVSYPFSKEIAALSAAEFLGLLHARLDFRHLWVGYDFAMGRDREGTIPRLAEIGTEMGYALTVVEPVDAGGEVISSSRIRAALREGQVREVEALLGRPYFVRGEVVKGARRGHSIGIPTANVAIPRVRVLPAQGVYASRVSVNGTRYGAATNIGVRPTFETGEAVPTVEAHILDFSGEIYGEQVTVEFVERLRGEQKFEGVEALVAQINTDIARAREILIDS